MDHLYVEVDNCKIAYIEKNKNASHTIFFIPGNSVSKRCWRKQYNSNELSAYRMIAIDYPAHGDSEATDAKEYTLPGIAALMSKVVMRLTDNKPFILAGLSLGTNVVAEMLASDIQPVGLVLAGPSVLGKDYAISQLIKPNTHVGVVFADDPDENDVLQYAGETSLSNKKDDRKIFIEDFKKVKPPFRSALGKSIAERDFNDEIKLLQQKNILSLVVVGKDEKVLDCNYLDNAVLPLWNKKVYKIEGASHLVNIDQPERFNQLLQEFAVDIFK